MLCKVGLESFGKLAPCQQDAPSAALAFESDIRAETSDGPLIRTARMLFAESQVIVETQVR